MFEDFDNMAEEGRALTRFGLMQKLQNELEMVERQLDEIESPNARRRAEKSASSANLGARGSPKGSAAGGSRSLGHSTSLPAGVKVSKTSRKRSESRECAVRSAGVRHFFKQLVEESSHNSRLCRLDSEGAAIRGDDGPREEEGKEGRRRKGEPREERPEAPLIWPGFPGNDGSAVAAEFSRKEVREEEQQEAPSQIVSSEEQARGVVARWGYRGLHATRAQRRRTLRAQGQGHLQQRVGSRALAPRRRGEEGLP